MIMIDYVTYIYMYMKKKGRNVHHLFDVYNRGCVNTPNQIMLHQFIIFPDLCTKTWLHDPSRKDMEVVGVDQEQTIEVLWGLPLRQQNTRPGHGEIFAAELGNDQKTAMAWRASVSSGCFRTFPERTPS